MGEDRVAMEQPTQEQLKEFWEWCGFKRHEFDTTGVILHVIYWVYPDGSEEMEGPTLDLDNLFRYAVPKLLSCEIETLDAPAFKGEPRYCACVNYNHPNGFEGYEAKNDNPALALFRAIFEVMEAEKKG